MQGQMYDEVPRNARTLSFSVIQRIANQYIRLALLLRKSSVVVMEIHVPDGG
jgi:hypothetical protein